jgi:hypothetical protein
MVSCARKSDLMVSLIKDACRKIEAFTEETGYPPSLMAHPLAQSGRWYDEPEQDGIQLLRLHLTD